MDLYWKLVKAGYVERNIAVTPEVGVPQGSLISPLLSNIYLNEFDVFIENLIAKMSTEKVSAISKPNPRWQQLTYKIRKLTESYHLSPNKTTLAEIDALRLQRRVTSSKIRTGSRIYYVRYADDWVLGILGSREFALKIKGLIKEYLNNELRLDLSDEKTKITHLSKERAKFLGMRF